MAVGTDNIDLEAAAARGIPVGNTPGVLTDTTADLAFALLLAAARRLPGGRARGARRPLGAVAARRTTSARTSPGATLGIVGWGRIGQAMARRGRGLRDGGAAQLALVRRRRWTSCWSARTSSALHTPLTPDTRHLIDAARWRA